MDQKKLEGILADYLRRPSEDDPQFSIIFDDVAKTLGLDRWKGMTVTQAEALWAGISRLVTMMLQNGFIAFDYADKFNKRIAWPQQDPKQVMTQIRNEWVKYKGQFPDCGFIVWFHNSKAGPLNPQT